MLAHVQDWIEQTKKNLTNVYLRSSSESLQKKSYGVKVICPTAANV
jgi:hypothetical protein